MGLVSKGIVVIAEETVSEESLTINNLVELYRVHERALKKEEIVRNLVYLIHPRIDIDEKGVKRIDVDEIKAT